MAGLRRTKASAGGVTIPIGSVINLLDTTTTVVQGGETFLQNGTTSDAATYPDAPVRTFMSSDNTHANASKYYGPYLSPYGSPGTSVIYLRSRGADQGKDYVTGSYYDHYILDTGNRLHQFYVSGTTTIWNKTINLSTVLNSTQMTQNGAYCSGLQVLPARSGVYSGMTDSSNKDKVMIAFTGNNNRIYLNFLNRTTLAHSHTVVLGDNGSEGATYLRSYYISTGAVFFYAFNRCMTAIYDNSNDYMEIVEWNADNGHRISGGSSSSGRYGRFTGQPNPGVVYNYSVTPEWSPYPSVHSADGNNQIGWILRQNPGNIRVTVRTTNGSADDHLRVLSGNNMSGNSGTIALPDSYSDSINNPKVGPYYDNNYGMCYMTQSQHPPISTVYTNTNSGGRTFPSRHTGNDYKGYCSDGTNVYVGESTAGTIFNIHPTTYVRTTSKDITTATNYPPKYIVYDGTHLYNVYGDGSNAPKVHKYLGSNGSSVANYAIDSYITGTNVGGIARDSSGNFHILDGSNLRLHKWNASWVYQSYVTLTGGGTITPNGISSDGTDFLVFDSTRNEAKLFFANGTYSSGFASGTCVDLDYIGSYFIALAPNSTTTGFSANKNVVGVPTSGVGATFSQYTRVK
jgi:hypothetical protein